MIDKVFLEVLVCWVRCRDVRDAVLVGRRLDNFFDMWGKCALNHIRIAGICILIPSIRDCYLLLNWTYLSYLSFVGYCSGVMNDQTHVR